MDYSQLSDIEIDSMVSKIHSPIFHRNYCNNPSDAWLVIRESKISINAMSDTDARGKWGAEAFYPNEAYHFNDNPLRASMIVFLMMQDTTHA